MQIDQSPSQPQKKKKIKLRSTFELKKVRLNSLKGVSLGDVLIVQEYPDVFPEELPGMPPDRDVEFLIHSKTGYRTNS